MATRGFNTWRHQEWGEPCQKSVITRYDWTGYVAQDAPVWSHTHRQIIPAVKLLNGVFNEHRYDVDSAGSYNCRKITNGSVYSPHAWPLAIDINPAQNPYRPMPPSGPITDIPYALIKDVYRIITKISRQRVWKWGGDWDGDWAFDDHTITDAMHFEVIATPEELAEGVTFDGDIPVVVEVPMLKIGDSGNAVMKFQRCINNWNGNYLQELLVVDGQFGEKTAEGVRSYQRAAQIAATGSIDGVTAALLLEYVVDMVDPKPGTGNTDAQAREAAEEAKLLATAAQESASRANKRLDALKEAV